MKYQTRRTTKGGGKGKKKGQTKASRKGAGENAGGTRSISESESEEDSRKEEARERTLAELAVAEVAITEQADQEMRLSDFNALKKDLLEKSIKAVDFEDYTKYPIEIVNLIKYLKTSKNKRSSSRSKQINFDLEKLFVLVTNSMKHRFEFSMKSDEFYKTIMFLRRGILSLFLKSNLNDEDLREAGLKIENIQREMNEQEETARPSKADFEELMQSRRKKEFEKKFEKKFENIMQQRDSYIKEVCAYDFENYVEELMEVFELLEYLDNNTKEESPSPRPLKMKEVMIIFLNLSNVLERNFKKSFSEREEYQTILGIRIKCIFHLLEDRLKDWRSNTENMIMELSRHQDLMTLNERVFLKLGLLKYRPELAFTLSVKEEELRQILPESEVGEILHLDQKFNEVFSKCKKCGENVSGFKICSSCKSVNYCSKKCQVADWPEHRGSCDRKTIFSNIFHEDGDDEEEEEEDPLSSGLREIHID